MHHEYKMKSVFFYGLFMDESLLREKGYNPTNPIQAYVDGYGLRIGERATLVQSEGERAHGTVMTLKEQEIHDLYGEESVADSAPQDIEVTSLANKLIKTVVYNLPMENLSGKNVQYARALALVAKKVGLPSSYIKEIESWTD